jgi:hypothetical protein
VNVTVRQFHDDGAAFLIGAELYARPAVEQYAHRHVPPVLMPRSTRAREFERRFAGAREFARLTRAFALSSNRALDGGGWIINPDREWVALTHRGQPFVTVDLKFAALRVSPAAARGKRRQYPPHQGGAPVDAINE